MFEGLSPLWRAEHLKLILDEVIESQNPTLIDYVLTHPRTHILFNYLPYVDRQLLIGYLLLARGHLSDFFESRFRSERPWLGPYVFYVLTNLDLIKDKFSGLGEKLTDEEDIAEYIEGVGSDQALFMVSELCVGLGDLNSVEGLDDFIDRLENHYMYF